jgi:hypothetical protein
LQRPDHTAVPRRARAHTTTPAGRDDGPATHHGRSPFRSATQGPMRRDYALSRFLHLTAKYRRA